MQLVRTFLRPPVLFEAFPALEALGRGAQARQASEQLLMLQLKERMEHSQVGAGRAGRGLVWGFGSVGRGTLRGEGCNARRVRELLLTVSRSSGGAAAAFSCHSPPQWVDDQVCLLAELLFPTHPFNTTPPPSLSPVCSVLVSRCAFSSPRASTPPVFTPSLPPCPPLLPSSPPPLPCMQCVGEQVCLLEALAPMACEVQGATSRLTALITAISGLGSEEPQVGRGTGVGVGCRGQAFGCHGG